MKLTKSKIKRLIKEELVAVLKEQEQEQRKAKITGMKRIHLIRAIMKPVWKAYEANDNEWNENVKAAGLFPQAFAQVFYTMMMQSGGGTPVNVLIDELYRRALDITLDKMNKNLETNVDQFPAPVTEPSSDQSPNVANMPSDTEEAGTS